MHPNDGAIWLEVHLVDANDNPLPLALGPASIAVSSTKLTAAATPFPGGEGDYSDFPLEIIAGTATLDTGTHQFSAYRSDFYISLKPSGSFATTVGGLQVELVIDENGRMFLNDQGLVDSEERTLRAAMERVAGDNRDIPLVLRADRLTPHHYVVTAMDVAAQMGFVNLSIATDRSDGSAE